MQKLPQRPETAPSSTQPAHCLIPPFPFRRRQECGKGTGVPWSLLLSYQSTVSRGRGALGACSPAQSRRHIYSHVQFDSHGPLILTRRPARSSLPLQPQRDLEIRLSLLEGSVREAGALADRALVCAAEESTRLRSLEDTIDSRLNANLRAAESNTAAAVTRVTANLSSWLSSSDARTDAKISQLPSHDQARAASKVDGLCFPPPRSIHGRRVTCLIAVSDSSSLHSPPLLQLDSIMRRIDDLERARNGSNTPAVMHAITSRLDEALTRLNGAGTPARREGQRLA